MVSDQKEGIGFNTNRPAHCTHDNLHGPAFVVAHIRSPYAIGVVLLLLLEEHRLSTYSTTTSIRWAILLPKPLTFHGCSVG